LNTPILIPTLDTGIYGIVSLGKSSKLKDLEKYIFTKETVAFVNGKVPALINKGSFFFIIENLFSIFFMTHNVTPISV